MNIKSTICSNVHVQSSMSKTDSHIALADLDLPFYSVSIFFWSAHLGCQNSHRVPGPVRREMGCLRLDELVFQLMMFESRFIFVYLISIIVVLPFFSLNRSSSSLLSILSNMVPVNCTYYTLYILN